MISMTGYGKSKIVETYFQIETEIKTVNAKFLDLKLYLPKELNPLETEIRTLLTRSFPRGTVEVRFKYTDHSEPEIILNEIALKKVVQTFEKFADLNLSERIPMEYIIREFGLIEYRSSLFERADFAASVIKSLKIAIKVQRKMASKEGRQIKKHFVDSINRIESSLQNIEKTIDVYKQRLFEDMKSRLSAILSEVDATSLEQRISQELAFYFDKYDIHEELQRMQTHISKFREITQNSKLNNTGKTLGFVFQEMQREANTLGSKFSNPLSFDDIIIIKEEVEKCREMILNVI